MKRSLQRSPHPLHAAHTFLYSAGKINNICKHTYPLAVSPFSILLPSSLPISSYSSLSAFFLSPLVPSVLLSFPLPILFTSSPKPYFEFLYLPQSLPLSPSCISSCCVPMFSLPLFLSLLPFPSLFLSSTLPFSLFPRF